MGIAKNTGTNCLERLWGLNIQDIQTPAGQGPEQPALVEPA